MPFGQPLCQVAGLDTLRHQPVRQQRKAQALAHGDELCVQVIDSNHAVMLQRERAAGGYKTDIAGGSRAQHRRHTGQVRGRGRRRVLRAKRRADHQAVATVAELARFKAGVGQLANAYG